MAKTIIGVVGMQASGKGSVARYLAETHNASIHRFSSLLREIAERLYILQTHDNLQNLSATLRLNFGEDVLARVISKDVQADPADIVVIDGVRRFADILFLRELPNFTLIKVEAEQDLRYKRLVDRAENVGDDKKSYNDFIEDERKEADREIPQIMAQTDNAIDNNGGFDSMHQQIEKMLEKLTPTQ
jgi:dephospho-CoA kinase